VRRSARRLSRAVKQFVAPFPVPGTEALRDQVLSETLATPQYVMVGAMEGMFARTSPIGA